MEPDQSTTTLLDSDQPVDSWKEDDQPAHIAHRGRIAWNWAVVTIPIALLTAALLGLVFAFRVRHPPIPFEALRVAGIDDDEPGVFLVDLRSSVLLFLASWASSLAPLLSGFLMTLALFPVARGVRDRSTRLPTPYQLALLLRLVNGSLVGGLWSWTLYLVGWRGKRATQAPALLAVVAVAVLGMLLGCLVFLADTWLHLTTSTVPFTQVAAVSRGVDYGFGLAPRCLASNNSLLAAEDEVDPSRQC
ncbi:hypothetical protein VTN02DRAFT_1490 [Thermoascus thermophilus]